MRRPHRSPLPEQAATPPEPVYDWARFGRHRFRSAAGALLDHPLSPAGWAATARTDPSQPGGWHRDGWMPAPVGGWTMPVRLALGDVVELGVGAHCWIGIVDSYDPAGWLTLQGPYPSIADAAADAERLLAAERYLPAIQPQRTGRQPRPCMRRRQRPGRHP